MNAINKLKKGLLYVCILLITYFRFLHSLPNYDAIYMLRDSCSHLLVWVNIIYPNSYRVISYFIIFSFLYMALIAQIKIYLLRSSSGQKLNVLCILVYVQNGRQRTHILLGHKNAKCDKIHSKYTFLEVIENNCMCNLHANVI